MRKYLLPAAALVALAACGAVLGTARGASTVSAVTPPTLTVVREGGSFEPVNVIAGIPYGVKCEGSGCTRNTLYKTLDDGVTWTPCAPLPNQVLTLSRLHSGTLIATSDGASHPWRSTDNCATWSSVSIADPFSPGTYRDRLPVTTQLRYYLLGNGSIADDGAAAYMAPYNTPLAGQAVSQVKLRNWVWRSTDDGQTWGVVNDNSDHKHYHGSLAVPGSLYVFAGDNAGCAPSSASLCTDGVLVSHDGGQTLKQACATCVMVDGALDATGGELYYNRDRPYGVSSIEKLDLATGTPHVLAQTTYESVNGGAFLMPDGSYLLGSDYENVGLGFKKDASNVADSTLDIEAIVNDSVSTVLSRQIPNANGEAHLQVKGVTASGLVVVYRSGYGAIFARYDSGSTVSLPTTTPATTTAPVIPTTTSCG